MPSPGERAQWLHRCCRMVLGRLGIAVRVAGTPPVEGLVVSNHLSYFDILLYAAAFPCVFVSKTEVRFWPLLGPLAAFGGTVFIDRTSASSAASGAKCIASLLEADIRVLVFPEGTSSDGTGVLRFHSSLFQPAVANGSKITAASISYSAAPHAREKDLCYYGDISFGPHLLKTLMLPEIHAVLAFSPESRAYASRKVAAAETWAEVADLRHQAGNKALQDK